MELLDNGFMVGAIALLFVGLSLGGVLFLWRPQAEPAPQEIDHTFDLDERRSKKKKSKDKKATSNGQVVHEAEVKSKKKTESSKKSPAKEKPEKKPKDKPEPVKKAKSEPVRQEKKQKEVIVKPDDYDEGEWEKVPSKNDKKNRKKDDDKVESPKNNKKKAKESKKEEEVKTKEPEIKVAKVTAAKVEVMNEIPKDLQDKVQELQRILNEVEKRDRSQTPIKNLETPPNSAPATPEVQKEKPSEPEDSPPPQPKPKKAPAPPPVIENGASFDEPEDTWTDAKAVKKSKKKPRKDQ